MLLASLLPYVPYREKLDDEGILYALAWTVAFLVCYWSYFFFLEGLARLGPIATYKLQKHKRPDEDSVRRNVKESVISLIKLPALTYFIFKYTLKGRMSFDALIGAEWWLNCFLYLFVWHVAYDTWFYWGHRAFHTVPFLYQHVHKMHHEFTTPIGISATYSHVLEDLLVNIPSTMIGVWLWPGNFDFFVIYVMLRVHESTYIHSGYEFPWSIWNLNPLHGGAARHDWHHSKFNGNYGTFFFWDWIMGTDTYGEAHEKNKNQ